jgi:lipoyl(octanoyl) transferase
MNPVNAPFSVQRLGLLEYELALERMKLEHTRVADGADPTLLLLEHPPVLTLGRKAHAAQNVLASPETLERNGIQVVQAERGGDVTYHGPGQLVGYPIFPVGRRVRDYLRKLENALIHTLEGYGLEAHGFEGYAGVFVGGEKIASIGVAIKRNVAFHGFALNVNTRLEHFGYIVPCGLENVSMTSLEKLLGRGQDMLEVSSQVEQNFRLEFDGYDWVGQRSSTIPATSVSPLEPSRTQLSVI